LLATEVVKMEQLIALNITAPMRLAYAAAPAFVARGVGTIINISSVVAVSPELLNGVYSGSKAFLLAFSQSLHHELADRGIRIQVVLPGATATELWSKAGKTVEDLPQGIVMSAQDMVDAALVGLEQGELVTIPSLPNKSDWDAFESARKALGPNLSHATPAERYRAA
jgi:short-subunit dehydrogenase